MAKLTGKKKLEFLARLNKGRVKAGLSRIKAKGAKVIPKTQLKRLKSKVTKRKASKPNKPRKRSNNVAKKKSTRRGKVGSFLTRGTVGKVAAGVGAATLVGFAADRFAPQISPMAKLAASFLAGGPLGAIAQFLLQGGISGTGVNLSNILGGGGTQQTDMV